MRLDKYLSDAKVLSRKDTAKKVKSGLVTVDGIKAQRPDMQISENSAVTVEGKLVNYNKFIYVMLNKPEGYVSATDDETLPCVTELLPEDLRRYDPFPCGRLDKDTLGLMILTNDGAFCHNIISPKRKVDKVYRFRCSLPLPSDAEERFQCGLTLGDGYECLSATLLTDETRTAGTVTVHEGKYHQVKRMIAALGSKITYLERISYGKVKLDEKLKRGEWRFLSPEEIKSLL